MVGDGIVEVSADEAIAGATPAKHKADSVVTFLMDILTNGPVPVKVIEGRAQLRGFSKDQLDRAKKKMGVEALSGGAGTASRGTGYGRCPRTYRGSLKRRKLQAGVLTLHTDFGLPLAETLYGPSAHPS